MKRYYARGGLQVLQGPSPIQPANYYTWGSLPQELWPTTNAPPLTQVQADEEADLLGEAEQGFAEGGVTGPLSMLLEGGSPDIEGPVAGPGTGRSDDIDARLSDGEYVLDAETVALLGDGSTAAGAEALDRMREAVRKHKGAALSKGKFSPAARPPLDYLMGDE